MSILVDNALIAQNRMVPGFGGITLAGTLLHSPGTIKNRVLGAYAIVLVLQGGGRYEDVMGRRSPAGEGSLITLLPDVAHRYGPGKGQYWNEIYMVFDGPYFHSLRHAGLLRVSDPLIRLSSVEEGFQALKSIAESSSEGESGQVQACLNLGSWLLANLGVQAPLVGLDAAMEKVRQALDKDLELTTLDLDLPRVCGLAYETIRKRFHASFGISPSKYRLQRRIEAAKSLLDSTSLANKEIADSLGFADEFHFSKRFKASTGVSPREFRGRDRTAHGLGTRQDHTFNS